MTRSAADRKHWRASKPLRRRAIHKRDLDRLERILGLLASDQTGERASAALAACTLLAKHGLNWRDVIEGKALGPKAAAALRRSEVGVDYLEAAESRMRQLRRHNDALEKEVGRLKEKLDAAKAALKVDG